MTERIRPEVDDEELKALVAELNSIIAQKDMLKEGAGGQFSAFMNLYELEDMAAAAEAEVQATVDRLTAEIIALEEQAKQTEAGLYDAFMGMDLPTVNRATRMILLRIPGLRESLRLLYSISMLRRTMAIPGVGQLTAFAAFIVYASMMWQWNEKRINTLEARLIELERITTQRHVSMEMALRDYNIRAEKYRSTVTL